MCPILFIYPQFGWAFHSCRSRSAKDSKGPLCRSLDPLPHTRYFSLVWYSVLHNQPPQSVQTPFSGCSTQRDSWILFWLPLHTLQPETCFQILMWGSHRGHLICLLFEGDRTPALPIFQYLITVIFSLVFQVLKGEGQFP